MLRNYRKLINYLTQTFRAIIIDISMLSSQSSNQVLHTSDSHLPLTDPSLPLPLLDLRPLSYADVASLSPGTDLERHDYSCSDFQEQFLRRCRAQIMGACYVLKLPKYIGCLAISVVRQLCEKMNTKQARQGCQNQSLQKPPAKINNILNVSAFGLCLSCIRNDYLLQELRIARHFCFDFKPWKQNLNNMLCLLKLQTQMADDVLSPQFIITKMCRIRTIRQEEQAAMVQMCHNLQMHRQSKAPVVAAIAFLQVCNHSTRYHHCFPAADLVKNHQTMYLEGVPAQKIQKYFDATTFALKRAWDEYLRAKPLDFYMPNWQGRLPMRHK